MFLYLLTAFYMLLLNTNIEPHSLKSGLCYVLFHSLLNRIKYLIQVDTPIFKLRHGSLWDAAEHVWSVSAPSPRGYMSCWRQSLEEMLQHSLLYGMQLSFSLKWRGIHCHSDWMMGDEGINKEIT